MERLSIKQKANTACPPTTSLEDEMEARLTADALIRHTVAHPANPLHTVKSFLSKLELPSPDSLSRENATARQSDATTSSSNTKRKKAQAMKAKNGKTKEQNDVLLSTSQKQSPKRTRKHQAVDQDHAERMLDALVLRWIC